MEYHSLMKFKDMERQGMITTCSQGSNLIMLIEDNIHHDDLVFRTTEDNPIPSQVCHSSQGNLPWIIFSAVTTLVIKSPALAADCFVGYESARYGWSRHLGGYQNGQFDEFIRR